MKEDGFKQYKHMKPVKRGSKVWVRSDATNGFVSTMQVYTGKKSGGQPKHGLGNRDVSDLVSDCRKSDVSRVTSQRKTKGGL